MKSTRFTRLVSIILCGVLIAAAALTFIGCQDTTSTPTETAAETVAAMPLTVKGEGNTVFYFIVVDGSDNSTCFEIHTDKTIVGEALLELGLIAGEDSQFGLYVKTVNGITADYDVDGTYWAFYEGDSYAATGVDATTIKPGSTYAFKVSK